MSDQKLDRILANQEAMAARLEAIEDTQRTTIRTQLLVSTTLGTHTEMLTQLLGAATEEAPEGSPLHDVLQEIAKGIDAQTELLATIDVSLRRLPALTADELEGRLDAAAQPGVGAG